MRWTRSPARRSSRPRRSGSRSDPRRSAGPQRRAPPRGNPEWTCISSRAPNPAAMNAARWISRAARQKPAGAAAGMPRGRHLLLPALQAVQAKVGWISPGALNYICRRLDVAPAEAYGVASFYAMLSTEPRPGRVAHACDDLVCRIAGAQSLCDELTRTVGPPGAPSKDGRATWIRSPCLGSCEKAPAVLFQIAGEATPEMSLSPAGAAETIEILGGRAPASARAGTGPGSTCAPQTRDARAPALRLLSRVGRVDPGELDDYRAQGGYQ